MNSIYNEINQAKSRSGFAANDQEENHEKDTRNSSCNRNNADYGSRFCSQCG